MAERVFQIATNGQQLQQADVNLLGTTSGLADDRVFAELLRMTPYDGVTVSKGVLPPTQLALVAPNGASGQVLVNPFRGFIGSRTVVGTEARMNLRDIRSSLAVAEGATASQSVMSITANAAGNPRWDLVYAAIAVDANSAGTLRKVKDINTKVVTSTSVVLTKVQTMTLTVLAGTPGASPAFPAVPADAGGTYNIPLAYVRVPNGFGAGSTVGAKDIIDASPILQIARATGASICRPASGNSSITGAGVSGVGSATQNGAMGFSGTAGTRPAVYMPPAMSGSESLLVAMDFTNGSSVNWSHQNGDIIDSSRDWRYRVWRYFVAMSQGSSSQGFPWDIANAYNSMFLTGGSVPGYATAGGVGYTTGMGASFTGGGTNPTVAAVNAGGGAGVGPAANGFAMGTNVMVSGTVISIVCDAATGNLKLSIAGVPLCSCFFWLDATAPMPNPY